MKKRLIAMLLVLVMALSLLTACGNNPISQDKAVSIALKDAGLSKKEVEDIHVHIVEEAGIPCYNVHFTIDGVSLSYNIATTGEIISAGEGGH